MKARQHQNQHQQRHEEHVYESSLETSTSSSCYRSSFSSTDSSSRSSSAALVPSLSRTPAAKPKPILVAEPLSTDWTQLEVIDLINDGTGLGFGIIGGRSTGVVVKTVLPGSIADLDGHLRTGDHILQIGDVNVRGMSSEQVALVLRQSGVHVRLVVARSILEPPQFQIPQAPIIPTDQLDLHMEHFNAVMNMEAGEHEQHLHSLHLQHQLQQYQLQQQTMLGSVQVHPQPMDVMQEMASVDVFDVDLMKDSTGLGITIAGYVGGDNTPDEISGIFVKSVTDAGPADIDGRVCVNDQIIEVDGRSLQGFSNQQAVEVLRNTGQMVRLKLVRLRHGPKFEKLQEYLAAQANQSFLTQPAPVKETTTISNLTCEQFDLQDTLTADYNGELSMDVETSIKVAWEPIVGNDFLVVVAQLAKFKEAGGLGISLEGTVDVEDGVEVRPHHYIRSILPDGPVGLNGRLKSGDELLEVNGKRLLGLNHVNVVDILKDLPQHVRLVCARRKSPLGEPFSTCDVQIRGPSCSSTVVDPRQLWSERLVKAKSEVTLPTFEPVIPGKLTKLRSRSLEPMSGLTMWSSSPVVIELEKAEKGLGFSILDYQDPVNPDEKVIVIKSLVPGGVAHIDGRLVPGDRLLFVNNENLEHATQAQAVQALKRATRGPVKIGVAKPLPLTTMLKANTKLPPFVACTIPPFTTSLLGAKVSYSNFDTTQGRDLEDYSNLSRPSKSKLPFAASKTTHIHSEQHKINTCVPALNHDDLKVQSSLESFADSVHNKCVDSSKSERSLTHLLKCNDSHNHDGDIQYTSVDKDTFCERRKDFGTFREYSDGKVKGKLIEDSASVVQTAASSRLGNFTASDQVSNSAKFSIPAGLNGGIHGNIVLKDSDYSTISSNLSATADQAHKKPTNGDTVYNYTDQRYKTSTNNDDVYTHVEQRYVKSSNSQDVYNLTRPIINGENPTGALRSNRVPVVVSPDVQPHEAPEALPTSYEYVERTLSKTTAKATLNIIAPIAKLDSTEFESDQEVPSPKSAISPPPMPTAPTPPLTPPLRPAPCSPKRDSRKHRSHIMHRQPSSTSSSEYMTSSDLRSPPGSPNALYSVNSGLTSPDLARVSSNLERTIHIHKSNLHIGLNVETVDKGVNGCVVKNIAKPSNVDKDGRLQIGDYIIAINNESLRRVSNAQARAIFRRSSLVGSDITITYIPGQVMDKFHQTKESTSISNNSPQNLGRSLRSESPAVSIATEQLEARVEMPAAEVSPDRQLSPSDVKPPITYGQKTLQTDGSFAVGNQIWGPARMVQLTKEPGKSLGISIVGGRVDMFNVSQEHCNAGIFIKHVLADSPAGRNGTLKKGDRILEVNGSDVRNATHDEAVEVIRNSSSPISFLVQSLSYSTCPKDPESVPAKSLQSVKTSPTTVQSFTALTSPEHKQHQEDLRMTESFTDSESEDEFGYTKKRVQKKHLDLPGTVLLVDFNRGKSGIGLGLAGNKNRSKMSVFVAGVQPDSPAAQDGRIQAGDEILEVNGVSLQGLSHLNASAVIKGINSPIVKLVIHRREDFLDHIAVRPIRYGSTPHPDIQPVPSLSPRGSADTTYSSNSHLESSVTSCSHSSLATCTTTSSSSAAQSLLLTDTIQVITLHKGSSQGLGFGIHEETKNGRHGIYVISITHGGVAEKGQQLEVGDEILEVGEKSFVGLTYDKAIDFLRSSQGSVRLKVRKPNPVTNFITTTTTASPDSTQRKMQLTNFTLGESSTDHVESTEHGDPRTRSISIGKRTSIEIEKGKMRLGLSIVGGSDTLLDAIIIHEIFEGGAAAKDGRLRAGDQLLEVNGDDLTGSTRAYALQVLSQTTSIVKMVVCRDDSGAQEDVNLDMFFVDLVRRPSKGLGLSIMARKRGAGIYVSDIIKGGVAEADDRLMHGDQIVAVNGEDMRTATYEYAVTILKTVMGKVNLSIGRLKACSRTSSRTSSNNGTSLKKSDSSASSRSKSRHSKNTSEEHSYQKVVEADQDTSETIKMSSAGDVGSPTRDPTDVPIIIFSMNSMGPAAISETVKVKPGQSQIKNGDVQCDLDECPK